MKWIRWSFHHLLPKYCTHSECKAAYVSATQCGFCRPAKWWRLREKRVICRMAFIVSLWLYVRRAWAWWHLSFHLGTHQHKHKSPTCSLLHLPYQGLYKHHPRLKWKALITSVIIDIATWLLAWWRRGRKCPGIPSGPAETPDGSRRQEEPLRSQLHSVSEDKLGTVSFCFVYFTSTIQH